MGLLTKDRVLNAARDINNLLKIWTIDIDGDIPLKFEDELSAFFFGNDVCRLLNKYYTLEKKDERKRRKQKAIRRWKTTNTK